MQNPGSQRLWSSPLTLRAASPSPFILRLKTTKKGLTMMRYKKEDMGMKKMRLNWDDSRFSHVSIRRHGKVVTGCAD
jgi:hypothetical protein